MSGRWSRIVKYFGERLFDEKEGDPERRIEMNSPRAESEHVFLAKSH